MRIEDVVRSKGSDVFTIAPDASVRELLAALARHNVGALVVSPRSGDDAAEGGDGDDAPVVAGIVSERDVVRRLHDRGTDVLDAPVSAIMTTTVTTCSPDASVADLEQLMTDRRIRHVPVVRDNTLVGVVSIGDVVKHRIAALEHERSNLIGYIAG